MFDGFLDERVDVGEVTLRVRYADTGPRRTADPWSCPHRRNLAPRCTAEFTHAWYGGDSEHHVAEENPTALSTALIGFLG